MKKLLFFLFLGSCFPLFMTAQTCNPVDTIRLYHEDFNGVFPWGNISQARPPVATPDGSPSTDYSPPTGTALHIPPSDGSTQAHFTFDPILIDSWWDRNNPDAGYRFLYINFTHICKMIDMDVASLQVRSVQAGNNFTDWIDLFSYFNTDYAYKGTSTNLQSGQFSEACYPTWLPGTATLPSSNWWKRESVLVSELAEVISILNDPANISIQFSFASRSLVGATSVSRAGWFIDEVSVFASKTEVEKPDVGLVAPLFNGYNNANARNNLGPYLIKSEIKDYSNININGICCFPMQEHYPIDPLHTGDIPPSYCVDSLQFYYTRRGTDSIYNGGNPVYFNETVTANTWITNSQNQHQQNRVNAQWTIPKACYGDTLTYTIRAEDRHGNMRDSTVKFVPWHNQTGLTSNDAALISINGMPHAFTSDSLYPINVTFKNISENRMKSVDFSYTITYGLPQFPTVNGTSRWTGNLCKDWDTTVTIGYFTARRGPDTICVQIINRNDMPDDNNSNNTTCFAGYACDSALIGDYTVGPDISSDFQTLEEIRLAFEKCGIRSHVRVLLYPGTYHAQKFSGYYYGQADTATITFMKNPAYPGDVIFVDDASLAATILLDTTGYFIFKDLVVQGKTNASYSRGFYINGGPSNDISILNCQINVSSSTTTPANYAGIVRSTAVTGNTLHGITVDEDMLFSENTISGGSYGIYYIGSTSKRNKPIRMDKNTISSQSDAIYLSFINGMISVDSNTVTTSNPNANGIYVNNVAVSSVSYNTINAITGIALNTGTNITTIDSNIITAAHGITNTGSGILVNSIAYNDITASTDAITLNNITCDTINANKIKTQGKGFSLTSIANALVSNNEIVANIDNATNYGAHLQSSNNLKFINNSVLITSTGNLNDSRALNIQSGNNVEIKNNILYNTTSSQNQTNYPIYIQTAGTGLQLAYNNYYSTGGKVGYSIVPRNNMSEWIYAHAADTNSKAQSLLFPYYPSSLQTDTCSGLECPSYPAVTQDILKNNRSNNSTWMGSYNFSKNLDIALEKLISPAVGLTCPSNIMPITVQLHNTGNNTIDFAATNVTLHAIVTTLGDTSNFTLTLNSGTLAPLASMNVIIENAATFPLNDTMSIHINVTLAGDICTANDSLILNNYILKFIYPFYEECFYNPAQWNNNTLNPEWTFQQIAGNGNWTVQQGEGTLPTIAPVYGTGRLFFNSRVFANNTESRAVMPLIKLSGTSNSVLEFWMSHDNIGSSTANPSNGEGVTIEISTDNGQSWSSLMPEGQSNAFIPRYVNTPTPVWTKHRIDLSSHIGSDCILIGFRAKGRNTAGNNINIDRVVLKDLKANDLTIENVYALGENPVTDLINQSVNVRVANEGSATQNGVPLILNVSGANSYTNSITLPSIAPDVIQTFTIPGQFLTKPGINTITVYFDNASDQYQANDTMSWRMNGNWSPSIIPVLNLPDTSYTVSYSDNSTSIREIGSNTAMKLVNRFVPANTVMIESVRFYPVNTPDAVGKRVRGFVSDASGNIVASSEIDTLKSTDIYNWVELPIINYALTSTNQPFYAGIEMIDPGYYVGTQVEAPIRDSAYYYMNGTAYTPQVYGRTMIDAKVHKPIPEDIAILSVIRPTSACDMINESVIFSFTQNGFTTIPAGTVTFNYSIVNEAGTVTTVSEVYNKAIAPHQTYIDTFNIPYSFINNTTVDSNYTLTVWVTHLPNDILLFNDTVKEVVTSRGKSPNPIIASPVTGSYYFPATLTATEPSPYTPGAGIFSWYTMVDTNATGDTLWHLEGRGNPFTTFTLFYDTTFFVTFSPGTIEDTIVGSGAVTTSSDPMRFTSGYSRGRIIYPQNAIGRYGPITEIALDVIAGAGTSGIPIKIYIKQVSYNAFPNTTNNWTAEIADATLVYDGTHLFNTSGWTSFPINTFNYTEGNLVILTETNCGGTNCQVVYGSNSYPRFRSTNGLAGSTQYVINNNTPPTANFTSSSNRCNVKFQFADLDCQSLKVPVDILIPDKPTYDVSTVDTLFHPVPNTAPGYCTMGMDTITMKLTNMLNTPIPASKVIVKAAITGYSSVSGNPVIRPTTILIDTISEPFAALETKTHTFSQWYNFAAPEQNIQNIRFNIVLSTDIMDPVVYRFNDTVQANVYSKQTDSVHNISVEADDYYTLRYTAAPALIHDAGQNPQHNMFYFYDSPTSTTMLNSPGSLTYLTPPLFDTVVYWVAARNIALVPVPVCTTRRFEFHINVKVPKYDLKTLSMVYPTSNLCGLLNIKPKVKVKNTVSDSIIPANTFQIVAQYTGSATVSGTHTITTAINPLDSIDVEFATALPLGSTTENRFYNYTIFTKPVDPSMYAYASNDTIRGLLRVPASPVAPNNLTFTVPYGQTQTVTPSNAPLNLFSFFNVATGGEPLAQGTSFTTTSVYSNPTVYYYSGQIRDTNVLHSYISGTSTGSGNTALPFATTAAATAKILYTPAENEWLKYAGRIDTVAFQVVTPATGLMPIKIYIKNANNVASLANGALVWANELNGTVLIYDNATDFTPTHTTSDGRTWFSIPIPGGFDYDGSGIFLYTEQDCGGNCSNIIDPMPSFKYTSTTAPVRMLARSASTGNYTVSNNRWNTKFVINNACESPRGTITINTTVLDKDLEITELVLPTTPNVYSTSETIRVKIKNHGSSPISSGFNVAYRLGNSAPTLVAYPSGGIVDPSATIAPGGEVEFQFNDPVDLSSVYLPTDLYVYIVWNEDMFQGNDTLVTTLQVPTPCISRAKAATGMDISNVTFAGINNGMAAPIFSHPVTLPDNGLYTDYSQSVAPAYLVQGQFYPFSMTTSYTTATGTASLRYVYIDFDRNSTFEASELVYSSGQVAAPTVANPALATSSAVITIPDNASVGLTRMRVIASQTAINSPCVMYNNGETEDYAVNIAPPFPTDMAIIKVLHPEDDICADPSGYVKVKVKNYGLSTMSFETNPMQVNAQFSGASSALYTKTVSTGSLGAGEEMIVTILGIDYNTTGTYNIKTYLTQVFGDIYQVNDTAINVGTVSSSNVATIPYFENFESCDTTETFPAGWTKTQTNTNFQWKMNMGLHSSTLSGAAYDHTTGYSDGIYAVVKTRGSSNIPTAIATLTTNCINMHYSSDDYPKIVSYYEHIFGAATAHVNFYVQVGSGNYYETIDTIRDRTQQSASEIWKKREAVLINYNENLRLRFVVTGHTGNIDPAIDDISIINGLPDISLEQIKSPTDTNCLVKDQKVFPEVIVRNTGPFPIFGFKVYGELSVGAIVLQDTVTWAGILNTGDIVNITFQNGFDVPTIGNLVQFKASTFIAGDYELRNDVKTIISCTTIDIAEPGSAANGIILGQNIPNPAGNKTVIPYTLPEHGKAVISIYSIEGQHLQSAELNSAAGENSYEVDVNYLADGIYLYTLQFKGVTLYKKMVVKK